MVEEKKKEKESNPKGNLSKSKQSLPTGCLLPSLPPCAGPSGLSSPAGREPGPAPQPRPTFPPALPLGGSGKGDAADSKIRRFCGNWPGPRSAPTGPWNTKSAPRPPGLGPGPCLLGPGFLFLSCLGAGPAARSFLQPPGRSRPACTSNNQLHSGPICPRSSETDFPMEAGGRLCSELFEWWGGGWGGSCITAQERTGKR